MDEIGLLCPLIYPSPAATLARMCQHRAHAAKHMPIGAKTPVQSRMPMTGRPGNVHIAKSGAPQSRMPISGRLVPHVRAKPRNPTTPRPTTAMWRPHDPWRHSNVRSRAVAVKGSVHNAKRGVSRLVNVHSRQGGMHLELVHVAKTGGTSLEQWIKNATGYHRNRAMGRCLTRHNRSTQTGTHCLSNYARRYRETLTFCVLRDPVNRTLSAFNGNPHLPCDPRLIGRWFADQSQHGSNNNEDLDQVAYLPFCDVRLCFERLQSDLDRMVAAVRTLRSLQGNATRAMRLLRSVRLRAANSAAVKSREVLSRRAAPCVRSHVPDAAAQVSPCGSRTFY